MTSVSGLVNDNTHNRSTLSLVGNTDTLSALTAFTENYLQKAQRTNRAGNDTEGTKSDKSIFADLPGRLTRVDASSGMPLRHRISGSGAHISSVVVWALGLWCSGPSVKMHLNQLNQGAIWVFADRHLSHPFRAFSRRP